MEVCLFHKFFSLLGTGAMLFCMIIFFIIYALTFPIDLLMKYTFPIYRSFNFLIRTILRINGLKIVIEGEDNIKNIKKGENYIFAVKHQTAVETLILSTIYKVCIVLKKSLALLPGIGHHITLYGGIYLDKGKKISALKTLIREGSARLKEGRNILIFPEGTRKESNNDSEYKGGVFSLYNSAKNYKVIPVANNFGVFFSSNGCINKYKGVATIKYLPPIEPGLKRKEFIERLTHSVETGSNILMEEAKHHLRESGQIVAE